jgi:WD40 repeat protein
MSPEQAELSSLDVDTRTDLYSLGVLLYELLTSTTPFPEQRLRSLAYGEMQRVIREEEPERPSRRLSTMNKERKTAVLRSRGAGGEALGELLKGDLDWIVMKCLEKDRRRRYESASGLADDLERHLANEPVQARPPSAAYRLGKAIRRNRGVFGAVAAIFLALVAGIAVSTWQAVRATRAETRTERIAEQLRKENYAADMHLAGNALESGLPSQARGIIERHRPQTAAISSNTLSAHGDLRGWEWRQLWARTRPVERFTFMKQDYDIGSVVLSPGNRPLIATLVAEGLKIWDFQTRAELKLLEPFASGQGLVFSPDGRWLACGGAGLRVWDTATWKLQQAIPLRDEDGFWILETAFSPDSHLLAGASRLEVKIWSAPTFKEWASLPAYYDFNNGCYFCGLAFSPDGRTLAYGISNNLVQLWDTVLKSPTFQLTGHPASVATLCFSPDGRKLVTGVQNAQPSVRVYDFNYAGACQELMTEGNGVARIRFSPDGKRLAIAGYGNRIQMFNTETWQKIIVYRGHPGAVSSVDFSPDGKWLASSSGDGTIRVWDGDPAAPEPDEKAMPPEVKWSILSPEGETLLTIHTNSTFSLWNAAALQEGPHQTFPGAISKVFYFDWIPMGAAVSPGGKLIAYVRPDGALAVWDVANRREKAFLAFTTNNIGPIRFSYDGNMLAFGEGPCAKVWDLAEKTNRPSFRLPGTVVLSFDFSRDGTQLAIGTDDSAGEIWSLVQPRQIAQFISKSPGRQTSLQIALSSTGRFAASVGYRGLHLWDLQTHGEKLILDRELNIYFWFAFSADESRLAASASGTSGAAIKVIDIQTGAELASFPAPVGPLSFLPDGNTLISLGGDSRLRRFRAAPFTETDAPPAKNPGINK